MDSMISGIVAALQSKVNYQRQSEIDNEFPEVDEVDASIEAVSNLGLVTVLFDPPIVMVPNDWERLWS